MKIFKDTTILRFRSVHILQPCMWADSRRWCLHSYACWPLERGQDKRRSGILEGACLKSVKTCPRDSQSFSIEAERVKRQNKPATERIHNDTDLCLSDPLYSSSLLSLSLVALAIFADATPVSSVWIYCVPCQGAACIIGGCWRDQRIQWHQRHEWVQCDTARWSPTGSSHPGARFARFRRCCMVMCTWQFVEVPCSYCMLPVSQEAKFRPLWGRATKRYQENSAFVCQRVFQCVSRWLGFAKLQFSTTRHASLELFLQQRWAHIWFFFSGAGWVESIERHQRSWKRSRA